VNTPGTLGQQSWQDCTLFATWTVVLLRKAIEEAGHAYRLNVVLTVRQSSYTLDPYAGVASHCRAQYSPKQYTIQSQQVSLVVLQHVTRKQKTGTAVD
jgi:hypothetical protein